MKGFERITCRGVRGKKHWAIATMIAMVLTTSGGPGFMPAVVRAQTAPVGADFRLDAGDLRFIFHQIEIAQAHSAAPLAAGGDPCAALFGPGVNQVGDPRFPFGLRTVDGSCNHLLSGTTKDGASDQFFPRLTAADFTPPGGPVYTPTGGNVTDPAPRVISNLVVDQTTANPAAQFVADAALIQPLGPADCPAGSSPRCTETFFFGNVAPDVGLSAPFNVMFTFFGQFFDHGLDLVNKGGSGTVFVPLQADDPLVTLGPDGDPLTADGVPVGTPMMLTRAARAPGSQEGTNQTTPFVDQNQTYTSHPSHQAFLREYELDAAGTPQSTGRMIDGAGGNIGNWAEVKAQAAAMLGVGLVDTDVTNGNVPLLVTDAYGYLRRDANGLPMAVALDGSLVSLTPGSPRPSSELAKSGHDFLNDIAHSAAPGPGLVPDPDLVAGGSLDTPPAGTYDNELLDIHFITGDGRGNENIALTAVHTIFHSEHNRLAANINQLINGPGALVTPAEAAAWNAVDLDPVTGEGSGWGWGERLFQAARFATEMQYQHLVFEEFARSLSPSINPFIGDGINFHTDINPAIKAEFAHAAYRLGHTMLTETISRSRPNPAETNPTNPTLPPTVYDIPLLAGFLNPAEFNFNPNDPNTPLTAAQAAGAIFQGGARQVGNDIDEFVTEAVRNNLVGLPLDLAVLNIARGRSEGVAPLNQVRSELFAATGDFALQPYANWFEFMLAMKHSESLANFIAAYGVHPSLTGTLADRRAAAGALLLNAAFLFGDAATTGVNRIDLWVGGIAEKLSPFGGMLGSTLNYIFEVQLESLQNGDRFYYLERLDGLNLLSQLEGNSFSELIMRNTEAVGLPANVFGRPDLIFNVPNLISGTGAPGANGIFDDPTTVGVGLDESLMEDLVRLPDGTVRYFGPAHVTWYGSDLAGDRIFSSEGDDTLQGNGGNDLMEGGAGNDQHLGGGGDDILTDTFGDDVMKGGPGDDAISGGSGPFDLLQGNEGNDFIVGGNDLSEVFGGQGNDVIYMGAGLSESIGGSGDDWMEGTESPASIAIGDDNNQFQNDPNGGHDILLAGPGDMDFDAEGGDDIMVGNVVPTHRFEGMLGYDWATYRGETVPVDADMLVTGALAVNAPLNEGRDRYDLLEGLSGTDFDDLLRGDNRLEADLRNDGLTGVLDGHVLTAAGIARITGLAALLPAGATSFAGGNIILGGPGSDLIEGRGGDDILDGDAWLDVQLQAPNPAGGAPLLVNSLHALKADVFAGRINPGAISYVRSIKTTSTAGTDTAVFTGLAADYTVTVNLDGTLTVTDNAGLDGTDTLRNIERLQFADGLVAAPGLVLTPTLTGLTQGAATTLLTTSGLTLGTVTSVNSLAAIGTVIGQSPLPGTPLSPLSPVALTVSLGPTNVAVPSLANLTPANAQLAITTAGLTVGNVTNAFNATVPAGFVATQTPLAGTSVAPGTAVSFTVSLGPAPAGLVLALGFDEATGTTAFDSSGGARNGTITQAVRVPGTRGGALQFDGINDWVTVADSNALDLTTGMTLEMWVKTEASGGPDPVLMKQLGAAGAGNLSYALYSHNGASGPSARINAGGDLQEVSGAPALVAGVWTHLATTYNGATQNTYINGVLADSRAQTGSIAVGTGVLRVGGANSLPGEFFEGAIDDVRVYNRALSGAEIVADRNASAPAPLPAAGAGLVLSFGFNEASGPALDASPSGHVGTIVGATRVAGVSGTALQFNGVDTEVTVPDANSLDLTTGMSIEAWVKTAALADGFKPLVVKQRGAASFSYALYDGTDGPSGFVFSGAVRQILSEVLLTPGEWTHLATTYDTVTQRFFVNGVLVASRPQRGNIAVGTGALRIGAAVDGMFTGEIDEVQIYNRARSAGEIARDIAPLLP